MARALHDEHCDCPPGNPECPLEDKPLNDAYVAIDAALFFLASSPEGWAYLLGLMFSDEEREALEWAASPIGGVQIGNRDKSAKFHAALSSALEKLAALELRGDGNE